MQTFSPITASISAPVLPYQPALNRIQNQIQAGAILPALDELCDHLAERRREEPQGWPAYARACLNHPIRRLLHQDPFTYRAFTKPRGYAGDAVMMDYVYGLGETEQIVREATPIGRTIFQHYIATRPSVRAVRYRRRLLASVIDRVAKCGDARVLAIAAGHLREAELSSALRTGTLREFVAFDQDEASLSVVAREYGRLGVRPMPGSVRQIMQGNVDLGQYDLVYAAGLFDYLPAPAAIALTSRMFAMTRPGGLILIPNFLTGVPDSAYMEAFMDWHLIYRNHADMLELASALPRGGVSDSQLFDDRDGAIAYLLLTKAG